MHKKNIFNIKITYDDQKQRIDNFVRKKFHKIPKNALYKMLRTGDIKINTKKIQPDYKLEVGDTLSYYKTIKLKNNNKNILLNNTMKKKFLSYILFEDNHLLILNKPTGIPVHGGSGLKFGIIEIFRLLYSHSHFLELIHRIDRNTSGILMLAKKKSTLKNIHQQFRENKIFKSYTAILHGILDYNIKHVSVPIYKNMKNGKKIITVNPLGKQSTSTFKFKKKINQHTLVEIIPRTGRTHQIRVHAAHIGHPIVFDDIYGHCKLDNNIQVKKKYKQILLHASKIIFYHPDNNKKYHIYAPLEDKFIKFFQNI
ncbi:RluA family pseudouridine synthase [Buchnera aphidicola]|uniref:Pseudouridine synthase n=1 Tax=Buchnera aphidicola (Sarucallis kahawaluokalani) TaxID=1241878 RepID=A0A4D6YK08_9GAMM|nr:RluA family pseudouridine synthase [Buchnera aphidicola]QCI26028.1 RluA family pseudouridine synthase [Buchnera aphidicola (Sarucallis kahawaluokalani)]